MPPKAFPGPQHLHGKAPGVGSWESPGERRGFGDLAKVTPSCVGQEQHQGQVLRDWDGFGSLWAEEEL